MFGLSLEMANKGVRWTTLRRGHRIFGHSRHNTENASTNFDKNPGKVLFNSKIHAEITYAVKTTRNRSGQAMLHYIACFLVPSDYRV